jgi:hypothetical protein
MRTVEHDRGATGTVGHEACGAWRLWGMRTTGLQSTIQCLAAAAVPEAAGAYDHDPVRHTNGTAFKHQSSARQLCLTDMPPSVEDFCSQTNAAFSISSPRRRRPGSVNLSREVGMASSAQSFQSS